MGSKSSKDMVQCPECGRKVWKGSSLCLCGASFPGPRATSRHNYRTMTDEDDTPTIDEQSIPSSVDPNAGPNKADSVTSDTLHTSWDELGQLTSLLPRGLEGGACLSADRLVIDTEDSRIEITAEEGSVELREVDDA